MGLVLTLREGGDFYLGERRLILEKILDSRTCVVFDPERDERFEVREDRMTEIAEDVMVCTAVPANTVNITIDAPRDMQILRGELKRGRKR